MLDGDLAAGRFVTLTDSAGTDFLFIQGGSAGGGTDDDLIVKFGNDISAVSVNAATAITVAIN